MTKKKACRKPLEKNFAKVVDRTLKAYTGSWFQNMQMLSVRGIPDRMGCIEGRLLALELKRSRAEAKKRGRNVLQKHTLLRIHEAGGYARVVYPENWKEIQREILDIAMDPTVEFPIQKDLEEFKRQQSPQAPVQASVSADS